MSTAGGNGSCIGWLISQATRQISIIGTVWPFWVFERKSCNTHWGTARGKTFAGLSEFYIGYLTKIALPFAEVDTEHDALAAGSTPVTSSVKVVELKEERPDDRDDDETLAQPRAPVICARAFYRRD